MPKYRAEFGDGHPWIFEGTQESCHSVARFGDTGERDEFLRMANAYPVLLKALHDIIHARDYYAECGEYPNDTLGMDQCFDDWAAEVAEDACKKAGFEDLTQLRRALSIEPHDWMSEGD